MSTVSSSPIAECLSLTRAISRTASPDEIFTAALDALTRAFGVSRTALLLADDDGMMRVRAAGGLSNGCRDAVAGRSPWLPDATDPQPIAIGDLTKDHSFDGEVLAAEGIAALTSVPLVSGGRVIGALTICFDVPRVLSEEERQLAEVIAAQVAFALERARADERSRLSGARLRLAMDLAAMGTWEMDLRTRTVTWSGSVERIHGYDRGTFTRAFEDYEHVIHPDDRERVLNSIQWAIDGGKPYDIEYRVIGADGRVRWIESKARIESEDGSPARMTGICMAVTRRKEAEFARLADAHEANHLKDQFLATLSHELRTPLNAIIGWIHVLERDVASPDRVHYAIDIIRRNARLQAQLIEDILDVSRIITGKLSIEPQPISVATLVDTTLAGLLPAAALKQIEVTRDLPDDLPPIEGDLRRLQQVLGNVISNAIKFTPEHGTVVVRSSVVGGKLAIDVEDSGAGIAPELLPFIFDRFRQGDSRSTRRHGGLGLGLAIARHLVELHGGEIYAHSEGAGRGTTFRIRLPIAARATPANHSVGETALNLAGVAVLVVDDLEDSRELLVRLLHEWGATVYPCASVSTALTALSSAWFDLLIADIAMPDLDGYDLIERVRALGDRQGRIPAIAVTAYARPEDRDRALAAGYNGHCPKPVDTAELARTIGQLLAAAQQPGSAA